MSQALRRRDGAPPHVVVAGGGIAAVEAALALRALAGMRVTIEVVAPDAEMRYPPLSVAEPFGAQPPPAIPLAEALAPAAVACRRGALVAVDDTLGRATLQAGDDLAFDALVLATGARALPSIPGALTFAAPGERARFAALLDDAAQGAIDSLAFAVPAEASWPLPLYELAIQTATWLLRRHVAGVALSLVTPEPAPLSLFGGRASGRLLEHIEALAIAFLPGRSVDAVGVGEAVLAPGARRLRADAVVTIPKLVGRPMPGVPHDDADFIPTDAHGLVRGLGRVYAAGDATTFPVKHGGLATQQADAVAEAIVARAGVPIAPAPFRPVLRGMLLTGSAPQYLETGAEAPPREDLAAGTPLWWPPTKVAGRYVGPLLAARLGPSGGDAEPPLAGVPVELSLAPDGRLHPDPT